MESYESYEYKRENNVYYIKDYFCFDLLFDVYWNLKDLNLINDLFNEKTINEDPSHVF